MSSCDKDSIRVEDPKTEKPEVPNPENPAPENPNPEVPNPEIPLPGSGENQIEKLITPEQFLELFPYRYGADVNNNWIIDPSKDFYTYDALIKAANQIADVKVVIERKGFFKKITRTQKSTNQTKIIKEDPEFSASWNNEPLIKDEVDYAHFINTGSLEDRKKELAAFLANISHETTGGWATAPGGPFSWGLHFREEVGYENGGLGYRQDNADFPPAPGQSYHGRGPIQLSWNYNYGQMSEFLYGDKNILLKNPGNVTKDAALAFQTAIWFWMTPQAPKPSCHAVMVGAWKPTQEDITAGRKPGFGMTINIINGGLECRRPDSDKTQDRRGFYQRYLTVLNASDPNCECKCDTMQFY
ncbi:hypothetical protein B0A66_14035 [Flavobacterium hercynium]|uniref:Glycoside hydrolase family 19 catalytic domain-containing protein n=2 Tax=Flavobacterium hercynium TaxID=387094 RepID=A0A226H5P9_9FLAO|nr:hypothetical protein B0A66_14035 [Flavobacterium hercynium]